VERVCQYFARYRVVSDPRRLASDLWSRYHLTNALDASAPGG